VLPAVLASIAEKRGEPMPSQTGEAAAPGVEAPPMAAPSMQTLTGRPAAPVMTASPFPPPLVDAASPDAARQIAAHVEAAITRGTPVDLVLAPAHLGPVRIHLTGQADGAPQVAIVVTTPEARDWLSSQQDALRPHSSAVSIDVALRQPAERAAISETAGSAWQPGPGGDPRGGPSHQRAAPQVLPAAVVMERDTERPIPATPGVDAHARGRFA
jgi:hypothetical protein